MYVRSSKNMSNLLDNMIFLKLTLFATKQTYFAWYLFSAYLQSCNLKFSTKLNVVKCFD